MGELTHCGWDNCLAQGFQESSVGPLAVIAK
jgi:hypothetical protein